MRDPPFAIDRQPEAGAPTRSGPRSQGVCFPARMWWIAVELLIAILGGCNRVTPADAACLSPELLALLM